MVRSSEVGLMAACQQAAREAVVDRGAVAAAGEPFKGTGPGPGCAVRAVVVGDAVHRTPFVPSETVSGGAYRPALSLPCVWCLCNRFLQH